MSEDRIHTHYVAAAGTCSERELISAEYVKVSAIEQAMLEVLNRLWPDGSDVHHLGDSGLYWFVDIMKNRIAAELRGEKWKRNPIPDLREAAERVVEYFCPSSTGTYCLKDAVDGLEKALEATKCE